MSWQRGRGYVYAAATLALVYSVIYSGEGWGSLTNDGARFFLSDGNDRIHVVDPTTFAFERTVPVSESGHPVWMLNELEWVDWELLRISPMSISCFGPKRSGVSVQGDHRCRSKPITA